MTWRRASSIAFFGGILLLLSFASLPQSINVGLPFGYFGKFNRIRAAIESRGDAQIVGVRMHRDLRLEDFWIAVHTTDGRELELEFKDASIRSFESLSAELRRLDRRSGESDETQPKAETPPI